LTKEVDVYCKWIDEAEDLTRKKKQGKSLGLMQD
jgi:transcription elongation factor Elf1